MAASVHEMFGFVKSHDTVVISSSSRKTTKTIVVAEYLSPVVSLRKRSNSRSNKPNVSSAGDCTLCERRNEDKSTNWFQMRSWSQATKRGTSMLMTATSTV